METNQTSIPETTPASGHPTEPTDSGTESHLILHEAPTAVLPLYPPEEAEHIASLLRSPTILNALFCSVRSPAVRRTAI